MRLPGLLAVVRGAMGELRANPGALWTQVGAMVANDVAWVAFWLIFFDRVGTVRGWDTTRVLLLFATLTLSAGLVMGLLANARRIGRMAADGELDAALALPVPPLAYLLVRRAEATHLGDVAFGVTLFAVAGSPTVERVGAYIIGVLASCVLLTGFLVTTGSLAFFAGKGEAGELGLHSILLLAGYPVDIFRGAGKVLLYTAVPAAFVAAVPSSLVDSFDITTALVLLAVAATFAALGWATFTIGLRRYTSGSVWTKA